MKRLIFLVAFLSLCRLAAAGRGENVGTLIEEVIDRSKKFVKGVAQGIAKIPKMDVRCVPGKVGKFSVFPKVASKCRVSKCHEYCGERYSLSRFYKGARLREEIRTDQVNRKACECVIYNAKCKYFDESWMLTRLPEKGECNPVNCVTMCYDWASREGHRKFPIPETRTHDRSDPSSWTIDTSQKNNICNCVEAGQEKTETKPETGI